VNQFIYCQGYVIQKPNSWVRSLCSPMSTHRRDTGNPFSIVRHCASGVVVARLYLSFSYLFWCGYFLSCSVCRIRSTWSLLSLRDVVLCVDFCFVLFCFAISQEQGSQELCSTILLMSTPYIPDYCTVEHFFPLFIGHFSSVHFNNFTVLLVYSYLSIYTCLYIFLSSSVPSLFLKFPLFKPWLSWNYPLLSIVFLP
jgi:hypothetical protein